MARLIDAEKMLTDALENKRFIFKMEDMLNEQVVVQTVYGDLAEFIYSQPTVDAVEVVHEEWVQKEFWRNGGTWRCSECGRQIMFLEGTPITEEMHYCPNCGADMRGEKNASD